MRVKTEPALPPGRGERLLLGGELSRRRDYSGRRRRSAEEVDLGLADQPAAELDVAGAVALVRRRRLTAAQARGDVMRRRRGRPPPRISPPWRRCAPRWPRRPAHTRQEIGSTRFVCSTGTQPSTARPDRLTTSGTRWTGIPMNRSYGTLPPLASRAFRARASSPTTSSLGAYWIPRSSSALRNTCETSLVTGTGAAIGKVIRMSTASRTPRLTSRSCSRNAPSNGAGGHLKG